MRIHAITKYSVVNGPGKRTVIHFQGCKFLCPGCFNPDTWDLLGGQELHLEDVLKEIPFDVEGVTISGGEPFLQAEKLLELVKEIRKRRPELSIISFSGFYRHEIENMPKGKEILEHLDVLIDGRYDEEKSLGIAGLRGSSNQTIYTLTNRYSLDQLQSRETEVTLSSDGMLHITGFPDLEFLKSFKDI